MNGLSFRRQQQTHAPNPERDLCKYPTNAMEIDISQNMATANWHKNMPCLSSEQTRCLKSQRYVTDMEDWLIEECQLWMNEPKDQLVPKTTYGSKISVVTLKHSQLQ
jgi:hypothetical protein